MSSSSETPPRKPRSHAAARARTAAAVRSEAGDTLFLNVFVDALGWPIATATDFLPELAAVRQSVETVLGYSSGAVPTILTGLLPRQHGQWTFFYYSPETSPFRSLAPLAVVPHRIAANHRVRVPLSKIVKRAFGYTGYFSLYAVPFARIDQFDYCEKRDLFAPGGVNGKPTIFDAVREGGFGWHVSDWRAPERENIESALAAVRDPSLRYLFLYLPGLDGAMHVGGHAVAAKHLEGYATAIRAVQAAAREIHPRVVTRLFSDHGMAEVRGSVDLRAVVETDGVRVGRDIAVAYDSTMVRLWWLRPGFEAAVRARLEATGAGRFLTREELRDWGLDFPGDRYGQAIFLCHPGTLVVPSDMGLKPIAGMHGYAADDVDSDGVLLSDHPLPVPVRRIDDLNTLMRADLGLPAAPEAPGDGARAWRAHRGPRVRSVRRAVFSARGVPFGPGAPNRVDVLGIPFDILTTPEVPAAVEALIAAGGPRLICPVNVDTLNQAQTDPWLRETIRSADYVYADGAGVVLGARALGRTSLTQRVTAADLIEDLAAAWSDGRHSVYFLGGEEGIAEKAAEVLRARWPGFRIAGTHHGYMTPDEEIALMKEIDALAPDVLFVGYGVPAEHRLAMKYRHLLPHVGVLWMVGALTTYIAGTVPRAPRILRENGLEWLFRLVVEPRRKWRRYVVGNPRFLGRILRARIAEGAAVPPSASGR